MPDFRCNDILDFTSKAGCLFDIILINQQGQF